MRKSFISALIVLITVSLIGLIAIQIYWIQNSITLRNAQFRRSVKLSLAEVNRKLEHAEKLERLRRHELGRQIILQFDSLSAHGNSGGEADTTTSIIDPVNPLNHPEVSSQNTDINELMRQEEKALEKEIRKINRFDDFQSREIARLILDISTIEFGSNFLNRYGAHDIDSLLQTTLRDVGGINTDYEFGVFDRYDVPQILPERSKPYISELITDGYKARLLPADYITPNTYLRLWFPHQDTYLLKTLWTMLVASGLFMLTIVLAFGYTIRTIVRQKKVSDIKNDFINNMTHELKTPISTISLACEALSDPAMASSSVKVGKFVRMIKDENKRLGVLVENVLRSALLDRRDMSMAHENVNLHEIIDTAIRNIELQAKNRGGRIQKSLNASQASISGDKIHLTNVIYNLLDNAIKYSGDQPEITVVTRSSEAAITIDIKDKGIGIRKDDQKRIFEKLFRVSTGNVHDIKGFGLGLSYVKAIVEKHHGTVSVQSEYGKGSTFTIQLPYNYEL